MGRKTVTEAGFYNGQFLKPGASFDDDVDLEKMSKEELVAEAASRGVDITPTDTKADIIAALTA